MPHPAKRRTVLCVRPRPNPDTASFLHTIKAEWIEALSLHCNVHVMQEDFDLDAVCDQVRPDFIVFETVSWPCPIPLDIAHADAHPGIPRAAILNGDPHEPMRPLLLRLLERYGVTTIFGFGLHHRQQMPELAEIDCFSVPIFVDRAVFHDYGLEKTIPVSVFGGHMVPNFYPWRARVSAEIQHILPTLIYPHPGYRQDQSPAFAVEGIAYARLINQSHFSIADTTRLDYVVRKHLEIPGAGTIMVAPASQALTEYGFVDMANCILGSPPEIYHKIRAVAHDPLLRETIRRGGSDLVHSRYTRQSWTCIADWFECVQSRKAGQTVRQASPMGPFRVAPAGHGSAPAVRDSPMSAILRHARDAILAGRGLDQTESALHEVAAWATHIAEPRFLLGVLDLLKGRLVEGAVLLAQRAEGLGGVYPALGHFDPSEAAWLLVAAYLLDHEALLNSMLMHAREIQHLSLRRVLWLLDSARACGPELERRCPGDCLSIHWLGQESFDAWCALVERILIVNGRHALADALRQRTAHRHLQAHTELPLSA